ncbi:MAG: HFX_2341 family transcriptional regulator domain-containing protein [Candidatus Helarchaeota archaeon]
MINKFQKPIIHIAFNGNEIERITYPIIESKADRAYIFTFCKEYIDEKTGEKKYQIDQNLNRYKEIERQLSEAKIEVIKDVPNHLKKIKDENGIYFDGIPVSYHNYVETIQKISKIIFDERNKNKDVYIHINIAVGSKITAIAGLDSARFWNVNAYYVIPEFWDQRENKNSTISSGQMEYLITPKYQIKRPSDKLLYSLKIINDIFENNTNKISENFKKIEKILGIDLSFDPLHIKSSSEYEKIYNLIENAKVKLSKNNRKQIDQLQHEIISNLKENNTGLKKSKLLEYFRKYQLLSSNKYENISANEKISGKILSTFYGAMNKQILEPLKEWNLIVELNKYKNKTIKLTDYGHLFLKIFKYDLKYVNLYRNIENY